MLRGISSAAAAAIAAGTGAVTTFLTGDVVCVTTNTFVNGPATASLPAGTYLLLATGTYDISSAGGGQGTFRIHNGAAGIADASGHNAGTAFKEQMALAVVVTIAAATTFTLQFCDNVGGSVGTLRATNTNGTTNKATSITAVRLG